MKFEDFLNEKKSIVLKRQYTENHPSITAGLTASVRNKMIEALADGKLTQEEFNTILSEFSNDSKRWMTRNAKYFNVSEDGVTLSRFGKRVLKTFAINENESFILESTRSQIGIIDRRGVIQSTYVHSDGYPEGVGQMAKDHFSDTKKMKELLKLGKNGISYLEPGIEGGKGHHFNSPIDGQTVFYGRDRGEKTYNMIQKRSLEDLYGYLQDVANDGAEYVYLWDEKEKEWKYAIAKTKDGRELGLQVLESELIEESIVEDGDGHVHFIVKDEAAAEKLADAIEEDNLGDCDFYPEDGKIYLRVSFNGYRKADANLKKVEKLVGMKAQAGSPEIWAADESVDEVSEKHVAPETYNIDRNYEEEGSRFRSTPFDELKSRQLGKPDFKGGKFKDIEVEQFFARLAGSCDGPRLVKVLKGFDKHGKKYKQSGDNMETYQDWITSAMVRCGFMVEGVIQEHLIKETEDNTKPQPTLESFGEFIASLNEEAVNEWGSSDNYAMSEVIHHMIRKPKNMPSPFDKKLRDAAESAVDRYWEEWDEYKTNYDDLVDNAVRTYLRHFHREEFKLAQRMFDPVESNSIEVGEDINEAFKSAKLAQLFNTKISGSWSSSLKDLPEAFYNMANVALDKVEDEDIIDMSATEAHSTTRKDKNNRYVIFYVVDQEKENPYADYEGQKTIPAGILAIVKGNNFQGMTWGRSSYSRRRTLASSEPADSVGINKKYKGWDSTGLYNPKRISEVADRAIVLDISALGDKYSTAGKKAARANAKKGAIAFKSDRDFKKENISRYKGILADKASKLPLDQMVKDAIDTMAEQIKQGIAKNEIENGSPIIGRDPRGRGVKMRDASNHMSNILSDFEDYVRYSNEAQSGLTSSHYYEERIKQEAKSLKDRIAKVEKMDYVW